MKRPIYALLVFFIALATGRSTLGALPTTLNCALFIEVEAQGATETQLADFVARWRPALQDRARLLRLSPIDSETILDTPVAKSLLTLLGLHFWYHSDAGGRFGDAFKRHVVEVIRAERKREGIEGARPIGTLHGIVFDADGVVRSALSDIGEVLPPSYVDELIKLYGEVQFHETPELVYQWTLVETKLKAMPQPRKRRIFAGVNQQVRDEMRRPRFMTLEEAIFFAGMRPPQDELALEKLLGKIAAKLREFADPLTDFDVLEEASELLVKHYVADASIRVEVRKLFLAGYGVVSDEKVHAPADFESDIFVDFLRRRAKEVLRAAEEHQREAVSERKRALEEAGRGKPIVIPTSPSGGPKSPPSIRAERTTGAAKPETLPTSTSGGPRRSPPVKSLEDLVRTFKSHLYFDGDFGSVKTPFSAQYAEEWASILNVVYHLDYGWAFEDFPSQIRPIGEAHPNLYQVMPESGEQGLRVYLVKEPDVFYVVGSALVGPGTRSKDAARKAATHYKELKKRRRG